MASKIRKPNFEEDYKKLMSAQNEEEVTEILLRIIKVYSPFRYKEKILPNPLFRVIVSELRQQVIDELITLRESISIEISVIESDLSEIGDTPDAVNEITKLKKLKSDCLLLIKEVNEKKSELENLL